MSRKLDTQIAKIVMGWHESIDYDYDPPQINWVNASGEFQYVRNDSRNPETVNHLSGWMPSTDISAAIAVQNRIAELGLQLRYAVELAETIPEWETAHDDAIFWHVAHATARQRCEAALSAIDRATT